MQVTFEARDLSLARQHAPLFTNISFKLHRQEILLIEGANGAGKSSLLRMLAGLSTPTNGDILWQNTLIHASPSFSEQCHYLGHANGLKIGLSAKENCQLLCQLSLSNPMMSTEKVLDLLQIPPDRPARELSAGQKRKLALARLFLLPKPLWILDEPFTALDNKAEALCLLHMEAHLKSNGLIVLSSHHDLKWQGVIKKIRLGEPC